MIEQIRQVFRDERYGFEDDGLRREEQQAQRACNSPRIHSVTGDQSPREPSEQKILLPQLA